MKKIVLMLGAAFFITSIAMGQDSKSENPIDYRDHLVFGAKLGVNLSNVYNTKGESFDTRSKLGFATGAFASIPIGRYFGVQPEVLFSQKGFRATGSAIGGSYEFTRTMNYIDIPLFFAFKPGEMLTLLAGPQISYLLQQKDKFKSGPNSSTFEQQFNNSNLRKNVLGMVLGADVNLTQFVLSARAGWDVQNNNGDGSSTDPRYKNVWYQATIGYRFSFSK